MIERTETLGKVFAKAERQLGDGPYFKGKIISNVDIAWLPLLHRAMIIEQHTCYDFLAKYLKIKAWQLVLMKTGLAEKSVPRDFEDSFTGFYLSENTFLGGAGCSNALGTQYESSNCC